MTVQNILKPCINSNGVRCLSNDCQGMNVKPATSLFLWQKRDHPRDQNTDSLGPTGYSNEDVVFFVFG